MSFPGINRIINLNDKTIWILTEERPKINVIKKILELLNETLAITTYANNNSDKLKIKPHIHNKKFKFEYVVEGTNLPVIIKSAKGNQGSFVDYLVFITKNPPIHTDIPVFAIEETKTTPTESRNVSVYQRLTKFVFLSLFKNYHRCEKIMLYNLKKPIGFALPPTVVFGIKLMKTLDVRIVGLPVCDDKLEQFTSLDELINAKNNINKRKGNTSVNMQITNDTVYISAKLEKSNMLAHDPNIGLVVALSAASKALYPKLTQVVVTNHGLAQKMIKNTKNKFVKISSSLNICCEGLSLLQMSIDLASSYWIYTKHNESLVSMLLHIVLEHNGYRVIYEHHSGAEQGYVMDPTNSPITVPKKYKKPDIVFISDSENSVYIIEAEISSNVFKTKSGIDQLRGFTEFESMISTLYPKHKIKKHVICFGDNLDQKKLQSSEAILFQLTSMGEFIVSPLCPQWLSDLFNIAQKTTTLLDYGDGNPPSNDS